MSDGPEPARPCILLVEDETLIRMDLARELTAQGFEVIEAGDASTGLELFRSRADIEAVVTDIHLPGEMSGYSLIQAVRKDRPGCTVIIATAEKLAMPEDFDEHVLFESKPYDPGKIALILRLRRADTPR